MKYIKNEEDYKEALKRIEEIFNAEPNTSEFEELDHLSFLVEAYEKKTL